jgi:hypothetical protein
MKLKHLNIKPPMKKQLFLLFLLGITATAFSQNLNEYDNKGQKHGKWVRYLDKYWKVLEDSSKAVYFRYTFYDHGLNVHPMGPAASKGYTMVFVGDSSKQNQKGIKILDGEYYWYDTENKLRFVHVLKNGVYLFYKEYYKTGELATLFDYTRHAREQPWSWYCLTFDKQGKVTYEGYTKKTNDKWPPMRG